MQALLVSTGVVALAEIGDKTQLLALLLAARLRKPWPIAAGIAVATLANHALAGAVGVWALSVLGPPLMRGLLVAAFWAMAVWMLIPDSLDEQTQAGVSPRWGVFGTTLVAFFLAEMGDKTQVATVMLAARYDAWASVVAGTTLGMLVANLPVVWAGNRFAHRLPLAALRYGSALLFVLLGVGLLFS